MKGAEEACGVEERRIQNPWTVGHEGEIRELNNIIERAVGRRNRAKEAMGARRMLRRGRWRGRNGEEIWEEWLRTARDEVMKERRVLKKKTKRLGKELEGGENWRLYMYCRSCLISHL